MNMIRHNDVLMQLILPQHARVIPNRLYNHRSNFSSFKINRPCTRIIEQPVQSNEGRSSSEVRRKRAPVRKTAVKSPSHKHRLSDDLQMWQTPPVKFHSEITVSSIPKTLKHFVGQDGILRAGCQPAQGGLPIRRRFGNLPY